MNVELRSLLKGADGVSWLIEGDPEGNWWKLSSGELKKIWVQVFKSSQYLGGKSPHLNLASASDAENPLGEQGAPPVVNSPTRAKLAVSPRLYNWMDGEHVVMEDTASINAFPPARAVRAYLQSCRGPPIQELVDSTSISMATVGCGVEAGSSVLVELFGSILELCVSHAEPARACGTHTTHWTVIPWPMPQRYLPELYSETVAVELFDSLVLATRQSAAPRIMVLAGPPRSAKLQTALQALEKFCGNSMIQRFYEPLSSLVLRGSRYAERKLRPTPGIWLIPDLHLLNFSEESAGAATLAALRSKMASFLADMRHRTDSIVLLTYTSAPSAPMPGFLANLVDRIISLPAAVDEPTCRQLAQQFSCQAGHSSDAGGNVDASLFRGLRVEEAASILRDRPSYDTLLSQLLRYRKGSALPRLPSTWDTLIGRDAVRKTLNELLIEPILHPERHSRMGIKAARGVLLAGSSGNGKSHVARALCGSMPGHWLSVRGPELISKYFGESERAIRELFAEARAQPPCIVWIDEIDAIAGRRRALEASAMDSLLTTLLTEIDGIADAGQVVLLACSSRPQDLDPALIRPGRIDRVLDLSPPSLADRLELLRFLLAFFPSLGDQIQVWAQRTDGFSFAQMLLLCRELASAASAPSDVDFDAACCRVRPSFQQTDMWMRS